MTFSSISKQLFQFLKHRKPVSTHSRHSTSSLQSHQFHPFTMPKMKEIHIDGSTLEGGGQLLRLALSLSCLTGKPIHVTDIRGNRPRSRTSKGRGGGLKKSHTECVKFLAAACNASTEGMVEGSDELRFWPGAGPPKATAEAASSGRGYASEDGIRTLTIEQKTPGSIYLILQALLPYLLFGPFATPGGEQKPLRLRITGGTNTSASPSHEYATKVLFPTLAEHLGIPPIKTELVRRGWSAVSGAEMGEVVFEVTPLSKPLTSFSITRRGPLRRVEVCIIANPVDTGQDIALKICEHFSQAREDGNEVTTDISLVEDSKKKNRIYALVIAEFDGPDGRTQRIGRDILFDGKARMNSETLVPIITNKLVRQVESEIGNCGAVDEYMQDQLVVFQALADGKSDVERMKPSLHARTARFVAERMLKGTQLRFEGHMESEIGICRGIGFNPNGNSKEVQVQDPPSPSIAVEKVEASNLGE